MEENSNACHIFTLIYFSRNFVHRKLLCDKYPNWNHTSLLTTYYTCFIHPKRGGKKRYILIIPQLLIVAKKVKIYIYIYILFFDNLIVTMREERFELWTSLLRTLGGVSWTTRFLTIYIYIYFFFPVESNRKMVITLDLWIFSVQKT